MALLESCLSFKYIAVDTEGYAPNILGISVANPALQSMYFPLGHREDCNIDEEVSAYLRYVLVTVPYRIMHHAGHDIVSIPYIAKLPFFCTMIGGHMVDENVISKGLDWMHKVYCDGDGKERDPLMQSIIDTMGWEYVPYALIYQYASRDAKITMELFLKIKPLFEEQYGPLWSGA